MTNEWNQINIWIFPLSTFPHISLSPAPVKPLSSMSWSGARQRGGRATGCHYYSPPSGGEPPPPSSYPPASREPSGYSNTSRGPSASSRGRPGHSPTSKPLEPHPVLPHIYSNQVINHCIEPPFLIIWPLSAPPSLPWPASPSPPPLPALPILLQHLPLLLASHPRARPQIWRRLKIAAHQQGCLCEPLRCSFNLPLHVILLITVSLLLKTINFLMW